MSQSGATRGDARRTIGFPERRHMAFTPKYEETPVDQLGFRNKRTNVTLHHGSVSRTSNSVPHRVNSECSYLTPFRWVFAIKETNVTVGNANLCLCGVDARASPSDRVNEIIPNTNTDERDSIQYHTMPVLLPSNRVHASIEYYKKHQ